MDSDDSIMEVYNDEFGTDRDNKNSNDNGTAHLEVTGISRRRSKKGCDDLKLLDLVEQFGIVLLEKSLTPVAKIKKEEAANKICQELMIQYAIDISPVQIKKKIAQHESTFKDQNRSKKTGNKPINLSDSEEKLFKLLGGLDNPSVAKVKYGISVGRIVPVQVDVENKHNDLDSESEHHDQAVNLSPTAKVGEPVKRKPNLKEFQRMVFEEQLDLIKMQKNALKTQQKHEVERHKEEMEVIQMKKNMMAIKMDCLYENKNK